MNAIRTALFSMFALCLVAAAPAMAEPFQGATAFKEHLQFLGYSVEEKEDYLTARHNTNYNLVVKGLRGGVLLTAYFNSADVAKSDRAGFNEFINSLNTNAIATRYYADSDVDLVAEAWYPGAYERERFGVELTEFNNDLSKLPQLPAEQKRYLQ